MEVDEALAKLGTIGRWQVRYFSMIGAACMVLPCFHMLAINYIGECTCIVHASVGKRYRKCKNAVLRTTACCTSAFLAPWACWWIKHEVRSAYGHVWCQTYGYLCSRVALPPVSRYQIYYRPTVSWHAVCQESLHSRTPSESPPKASRLGDKICRCTYLGSNVVLLYIE